MTLESRVFSPILRRNTFVLFLGSLLASLSHAQSVISLASNDEKRPITVDDALATTRLADTSYFWGQPSKGRVALFSPDGKQFLITLRKGRLDNDTNEYSIYAFSTSNLFEQSKPLPVVTMASSSNREAITHLRWLDDNETIAFLGEMPHGRPQLYTFNLRTRRLTSVTQGVLEVADYAVTADGTAVFVAVPPWPCDHDGEKPTEAVVVERQRLSQLLARNCETPVAQRRLFVQPQGKSPMPIVLNDEVDTLSISPDGRFALIGVDVRALSPLWNGYSSAEAKKFLIDPLENGAGTDWKRYLLLDTVDNSVVPLLNAPVPSFGPVIWNGDSREVFLKSYLPLNVDDSQERLERSAGMLPVEVHLPSRELRRISEAEWASKNRMQEPEVDVTLKEDVRTAPRLFVAGKTSRHDTLLMDLNPQFEDLRLGQVETIRWTVHGVEVEGALYLPSDYDAKKKYPLLIQTHGYDRQRFAMDGLDEWSSAFAARPLAAAGMLVLQTLNVPSTRDWERIGGDKTLGATREQRRKHFDAEAYESAIAYLRHQGRIDSTRVGITGFSRYVCHVGYLLTHTKFRFRAAVLTDGDACSYFDYLAFPYTGDATDTDQTNGGMAPFTRDGLKEWMNDAPGFNLEDVNTPIRVVGIDDDGVLEMWEWFAGLKLQGKPVDFIEIPTHAHLLTKPSDRRIAMQGIVDWFRFWLKGEEDPAAEKAEQYKRWRELKRLQDQNEKKAAAAGKN